MVVASALPAAMSEDFEYLSLDSLDSLNHQCKGTLEFLAGLTSAELCRLLLLLEVGEQPSEAVSLLDFTIFILLTVLELYPVNTAVGDSSRISIV